MGESVREMQATIDILEARIERLHDIIRLQAEQIQSMRDTRRNFRLRFQQVLTDEYEADRIGQQNAEGELLAKGFEEATKLEAERNRLAEVAPEAAAAEEEVGEEEERATPKRPAPTVPKRRVRRRYF